MKGFLRREWYLVLPNLRFYVIIMAVIFAGSFFAETLGSMFALYAVIFGMSGILGLFTYDEANHWQAYGAAAPGGRRAMVDARYAFALGNVLAVMAAIGLWTWAGGKGLVLWSMGMYGGVTLLTLALVIPLTYRFGGFKARIVTMILMVGLMGGMVGGILFSAREDLAMGRPRGDVEGFFSAASLAATALGLAALAVSRGVSLHIMDKKEF